MPFGFLRPGYTRSSEPEVREIDPFIGTDMEREVNELSEVIGHYANTNRNASAQNSVLEAHICRKYRISHAEIVEKQNAHVGDFVYYSDEYFGDSDGYMLVAINDNRLFCASANGSQKVYNRNATNDIEELCVFKPCSDLLNRFFEKLRNSIYWDEDNGHIAEVVSTIKDVYPDYYRKLNVGTCAACGRPAIPKVTVDGVDYCNDCYNKKFTSCSRCGKIVKRGEEIRDRNDYALCSECNKRHWVLPYHGYYPEVEFYGDNKGNSVPYMGFELEVDCGGENDRKVANVMPLLNNEDSGKIFAYCSHDGSLQNGFEIITQPATMQYHSSISDVYNRSIQKLKAMGYASHETTTCGFHVHFNRSFFGDNQNECIRRLIFMTEKFWNELCVFARRPERRLERYAKKVSDSMEIKEYMEKANRSGRHEYHYYAVNIANDSTIEFRMFRGTLNLNTIMATLQLVNNMAITAKNKTMDEIKAMHFEDLLTTAGQRKYWARHKAVADFEE